VENDEQYFLMLADPEGARLTFLLLARVVLEAGDNEIADDIFLSYDQFLHALADPDARTKLEAVRFEDALDDQTYAGLRDVSQRFRRGVTRLFFDVHPRLPKLIRDFGVF
jgi:hypothetical protein